MTNAAVSACSRESALLKSVLQAAVRAAHLPPLGITFENSSQSFLSARCFAWRLSPLSRENLPPCSVFRAFRDRSATDDPFVRVSE